MTKVIVHPHPTGATAVTYLAPENARFSPQAQLAMEKPQQVKPKPGTKVIPGPTVEVAIPRRRTHDEEARAILPPGTPYLVIDDSQLPDEYFRDAWQFHGTLGATIVPEKAKEVQRNHWRKLRGPLLNKLDQDFMRALETGDTTAQKTIAAQKQALRDVTLTELPDDPAQIKKVLPLILS